MQHVTVLLHEAIDGLAIQPGDIVVDGTLGGGGHTEEIIRRFGDTVKVIAIDLDADAHMRSKARLAGRSSSVTYLEGSFRNLDPLLTGIGVGSVNRILLDIGLSSNQFEESGRGFSFQRDEPLLMSFKRDLSPEDLTAREIVNTWDEENIAAIISGFGEERFAGRIARAIVRYRALTPIEKTSELVDIILSATPKFYHHQRIHPATRTFQALRIATNDELGALSQGIRSGFDRLAPGGRLAVISFHSLEDRIVKQFFKDQDSAGTGTVVTKKPIVPTEEEISMNSRSRSAKLRIIEKN